MSAHKKEDFNAIFSTGRRTEAGEASDDVVPGGGGGARETVEEAAGVVNGIRGERVDPDELAGEKAVFI